jgi:hypothetical protein
MSSATVPGGKRGFAYDLAARKPAMRALIPRGAATSSATAIDGDIVVGWWASKDQAHLVHAFAYDLAADDPHFLDLGPGGRVMDVDGDVVVGGPIWRPTAWLLDETTQPMLAFRRVDHRVKEDVGRVTIRVIRYGRTDRAVTVRYQTRSRTAKAGQDFVAASGKLRFARGVTRRSFTVKILDDRKQEGDEYLLLTLSRPSSPALLGSPWSQLSIKDNDR